MYKCLRYSTTSIIQLLIASEVTTHRVRKYVSK